MALCNATVPGCSAMLGNGMDLLGFRRIHVSCANETGEINPDGKTHSPGRTFFVRSVMLQTVRLYHACAFSKPCHWAATVSTLFKLGYSCTPQESRRIASLGLSCQSGLGAQQTFFFYSGNRVEVVVSVTQEA